MNKRSNEYLKDPWLWLTGIGIFLVFARWFLNAAGEVHTFDAMLDFVLTAMALGGLGWVLFHAFKNNKHKKLFNSLDNLLERLFSPRQEVMPAAEPQVQINPKHGIILGREWFRSDPGDPNHGEAVDIEVQLPRDYETEHMLLLGRTGQGKTSLLSYIFDQLWARHERMICYCFKGDYISRFYHEGHDILFAPLDKRCVGWNLFNEIHTVYDVVAVAHSLIPPSPADMDDNTKFFNDAARAVFKSGLLYLIKNGMETNKDIWEFFTAPTEQIKGWLETLPECREGWTYIQDASGKQAAGVMSTLMQHVAPFEYLQHLQGDFSFRREMKEDIVSAYHHPTIFIANRPDMKDLLRPILSLVYDLCFREVLSWPDDRDRRVFFIADEVNTMQALPSMISFLQLARSKGGCLIAAAQELGGFKELYGQNKLDSIYNNFGTKIIFRVEATDTAEYLSRSSGRHAFQRKVTSSTDTYNSGGGIFSHQAATEGWSQTETTQRHVEERLLSSEFTDLQKGFTRTRLASSEVWLQMMAYRLKESLVAEPYIPRDDMFLRPKDAKGGGR